MDSESDVLVELREMASNDGQPDCDIDTLKRAADEIERLRKLWKDAVDDKYAWAKREVRAERECCAALADEEAARCRSFAATQSVQDVAAAIRRR